jgi:hypothetical protein
MKDTETDDHMELLACDSALSACLQQIAEACPRMVAIAWIIDGDLGSVCAVRETHSRTLVVAASAREQLKALAAQVEDLPELMQTTFDLERAHIRASRAARHAESPQDAPTVKG